MSLQTNAKPVLKIYKGETEIWSDTNYWTPCQLGTGITGMVLFKNNGNGTASLIGSIQSPDDTNRLLVYPPTGYQFVSELWTKISIRAGKYGLSGTGDNGGVSIVDGAIYFNKTNTTSFSGDGFNMVFEKSALESSVNATADYLAHVADPALINIKSV